MAGEGGERGQNPKPLHFVFIFFSFFLHFSFILRWIFPGQKGGGFRV